MSKLDEEQQDATAYESCAHADETGCEMLHHGHSAACQIEQKGRDDEQRSAYKLALEVGVDEHKFLGNKREEESEGELREEYRVVDS